MKKAIIIGAGPAGLTAAYELITRTDIQPIIIEKTENIGGLSRTINYKGFRMDLGGHRFFTKSDRVMDWWLRFLPLQSHSASEHAMIFHRQNRTFTPGSGGLDPNKEDRVMLIRHRKSRIYFKKNMLEYPIQLNIETIRKLGLWKIFIIGFSYLRSVLFPIREEKNLEQFFINRFGRELYQTFFKSYTEKVWGVPCDQIDASWGAHRVKGLSIGKTILHILKGLLPLKGNAGKENIETSLIEMFLYPKYGSGQMWEEVAKKIIEKGGEIHTLQEVSSMRTNGSGQVLDVEIIGVDGKKTRLSADYFFSTMPISELIHFMTPPAPEAVQEIAKGLVYRDFLIVGLLFNHLMKNKTPKPEETSLKDHWIYIQEEGIRAGRVQFFNNWSPHLVPDLSKIWVGVEYFCNQNDELWRKSDPELIRLATNELAKTGLIAETDLVDATVCRQLKAYPAYFGSYGRFPELQTFLDYFENLFLIGRNGMHKYNNQDHSMLSAMVAVDNIIEGRKDKSNLWAVNTETDYHETDR